ncbi:MAG: class I SAM-dependent methyltransferase, partial [Gammaproteobacteria bacterium]|nr:class I SAM-dependent methyltransferase [Gammaproteobacteria bacterium]
LDRADYDTWLLDISPIALATARDRLGGRAHRVRFIQADVTRAALPHAYFDVWHDRAVFHFLTDECDRRRYVSTALSSVKPGGYLLIATFASDGPERCSGLPVMRYDAETLAACFADGATRCRVETELHRTPAGAIQRFIFCLMQRCGDSR